MNKTACSSHVFIAKLHDHCVGAHPSLYERRRCVTRFAFFYRSATRGHTWFAVEISNSASWSLSVHCWVSNDLSLLIYYRTAPVEPSTCPFTRMSFKFSFWIGSPPFSSVHRQNKFFVCDGDKNVNGASKVCSIVCLEQAVDCLILSVKSKNCLSISSLQIDF